LRLLIRGGRVVDPATQHDAVADVLIEDDTILAVERNLDASNARIVDARGLVVAPGLVDMHVHFREPGFEYKEDIETGSRAAARGGFTAVACMPNTNPVIDAESLVAQVIQRGNDVGLCRVYPIAAITKGQKGAELTEMRVLSDAGAVGFSDDGLPVESARVMRRAMEYATFTGRPIIAHCEEKSLAAGGHMHEGEVSTRLGIPGMPGAAEDLGVAREVRLAEMAHGRLHVCHVSTARSVDVVRRAKERGVRVTAEATPHHFTLTDEAVAGFDANAKMNPPLRPESDRQAVIRGLLDGTLDAVATDHAPHAAREKLVEFDRAPFGIIGLETSLALSLEVLVRGAGMDLLTLVDRMSATPARLLGLEAGSLRPGAPADVVVFDTEAEWTFTEADVGSRARNTPFFGRKMTGRVLLTLLDGRATWESPAIRARLGVAVGVPAKKDRSVEASAS
jgi:dihydroorotase